MCICCYRYCVCCPSVQYTDTFIIILFTKCTEFLPFTGERAGVWQTTLVLLQRVSHDRCGVRQVAWCDRILSRLATVTGIDSLFHATLTPTVNCSTQSWHPLPKCRTDFRVSKITRCNFTLCSLLHMYTSIMLSKGSFIIVSKTGKYVKNKFTASFSL